MVLMFGLFTYPKQSQNIETLGLCHIHMTNKLHQYFYRVIHPDAHNDSAVYNEFTNLTVGDKGCLKRQFYHKEMYSLTCI